MTTEEQDAVLKTAINQFQEESQRQQDNRKEALVDLKMLLGGDEQWDQEALEARSGRPCLTINKLPKFVKQITGDQRQNRPAIKVRAVDSKSDPQIASIIEGHIRNIEYNSNAAYAYDHAFKYAAGAGIAGYWRILTKYTDDDVFEQDIVIEPVRNHFSVVMDTRCLPYMGKERFCFISEMIPTEQFKKDYPDAAATDFSESALGDSYGDWFTSDEVRISEYFYLKPVTRTIYQLESGEVVQADKVKKYVQEIDGQKVIALSDGTFSLITKERQVESHDVMWCKLCGSGYIEKPRKWAGKYIPVIGVMAEEWIIEGKSYQKGAIRDARDPQRQYNYMASANIETIALSPKAPTILTTEQIQGHEQQWDNANNSAYPYLLVNPTPAGLPQRQQPVQVNQGIVQAMMQATQDLKETTGMFDASLGSQGNEQSGRAILARQKEGDTVNFEFIDNLTRAIQFTGKILVDLIPRIYDTERTVRVLNPDETEAYATINKTIQDPTTGETTIINDLTVGKYDVVVTVGPSYTTQRMETAQAMTEILQAVATAAPQIIPVILPRMFKAFDWPEAQEMAEEIKQLFAAPPMPPGGPQGMPQGVPPEMAALMGQNLPQEGMM
jgi:hypothetical protein